VNYLIYNPFAGKLQRNPGLMERAISALRESIGAVELRPTFGPNSAASIARDCIRAGATRILVAGGDGTINEAANGMIGSGVPMGILPGGTANVLAMELKLGGDPLKVARRIARLQPTPISTGVLHQDGAEPRHFLLMAGVGLDAAIVRAVKPDFKRRFGKAAYWIGGFSWLGKSLAPFRVRFDGRTVDATFALASRVKNYGGDLEIARHASLLDDEFAVVLFEGPGTLPYLKYFSGVLVNALEGMKGVTVAKTRCLEFLPSSDTEVDVQLDGELVGSAPVRVEIQPRSLHLLLPPEFVTARR
jgi:diacylglycerol kinase family enzyme